MWQNQRAEVQSRGATENKDKYVTVFSTWSTGHQNLWPAALPPLGSVGDQGPGRDCLHVNESGRVKMLERVEPTKGKVPASGKRKRVGAQGLAQGCPQWDPTEQEDLRNDGAGTSEHRRETSES